MKVYLASDHAGLEHKNKLLEFLKTRDYDVVDCGAYQFDKLDDYPDFINKAAELVANNKDSFGFVFGKSGSGEMICANKTKGIRCALAINEKNVILSREHNNANMLSFGSDFTTVETMQKLSELFIKTDFSSDERHIRRINKITKIEELNG